MPVEVSVTKGAEGKPNVGPPHDDIDLFRAKLLDCMGTRSTDFAAQTLTDVSTLAGRGSIEKVATNAALALMSSMKPQNEAEAMLIAQMAGAHAGAVDAMKRMHRAEWFNQVEGWGRLANAFARTYALQLQTLDKMRRRGAQTVRVEHVHVHQGGQAVVGNVVTGGRDAEKFDEQPHAPQLASGAPHPFAPVWGEDALGEAVPRAGGEGAEAVQNARGHEPRRADRK